MGERISQYGWTPERMWGAIAVAIASAYGLAAWWAVYKGRREFDEPLRPLQTKLAIGLCGLALFLALPILDFGAISARSQLARLDSGKVKAEEFDWRAMAFDFGPEGRERLSDIARQGRPDMRTLASQALKADNRYDVAILEQVEAHEELDRFLRKVPSTLQLTPELRLAVANTRMCSNRPCVLVQVAEQQMALAGRYHDQGIIESIELSLVDGKWQSGRARTVRDAVVETDLTSAPVEIRTVERKQLYIDGKPIGADME
jgi:hypothetical protein